MLYSYDLMEHVAQREARGCPLPKECLEALASHTARYGETREPAKWVCSESFKAIKEAFKEFDLPFNRRIMRQLKRGIADKQLTKIFYFEDQQFKTLKNFGSNYVSTKAWTKNFRLAKKLVKESMHIVKLRPMLIESEEDVNRNLSTLDSSAGFLAYGKKKKDVIPEMVDQAKRLKVAVANCEKFEDIVTNPYIALTRSQVGTLSDMCIYVRPTTDEGVFKWKTRLVWCGSAETTLFESQYARPLINYLSSWANIAMGKHPVEVRSQALAIGNMSYWWSIDYSKYDSTVQSWLIKEAFDIFKEFFDEEYHREIDFCCHDFINSKILMPDGKIWVTNKGIPSGSYFTQLVGSVCNALMLITYLSSVVGADEQALRNQFTAHNGKLAFSCLGDDNLFGFTRNLDFEALRSYFRENFGIAIDDKSKCDMGKRGDRPAYLKRKWSVHGEFRDEVDLLLNLLHPEYPRSWKGYSPWHILFGYYLTFEGSMRRLGFSKEYLVRKMDEHGGFEILYTMPIHELPGSLGALARTDNIAWRRLLEQAADRYLDKAGA